MKKKPFSRSPRVAPAALSARPEDGTWPPMEADGGDSLPRTGSFLPSEISEIPRATGVYLMFDARGKVIYVGKAVNLRARVRQYFARTGGDERLSVPLILRSLHHIETIITTNEKEAFLLENTLIKRYRPRYNVLLRDDKTFVSVRIDPSEPWPKAVVTRVRKPDKALYFGPYTDSRAIRSTLNLLRRTFPLCSCSDAVFRHRTRPCLQYQIGLCPGPCAGKITREAYMENVRHTILFLKGHTGELLDSLRRRMAECCERMEYESAGKLRDQIAAIESTAEAQRVVSHETDDRDVIGFTEESGHAGIAVLYFRGGQLVERLVWVVPVYGEPIGRTLSLFLGQHYGRSRLAPAEIMLSTEPEDAAIIQEWLSEICGGPVRFVIPRRGGKVQLIGLAEANAREALAHKLSGKRSLEAALDDLARRLHLPDPPHVIECYDIATLQGANSTGSKVEFRDGAPNKEGYRLFKIKSVAGQDDFAMMREVLTRRFRSALEKKVPLPDLVIVDGGRGHLNAAQAVFEKLGLEGIAVAALVKEHLKLAGPASRASSSQAPAEKTRTREYLLLPARKNPVVFPPRAPSFYLLQRLRDEAHRFVNTYHLQLRRKSNLISPLREIPGVGPARSKALLRHFGSLTRIRAASLEEIEAAPGISASLAAAVFQFFHAD